jgi:hypothetical protein
LNYLVVVRSWQKPSNHKIYPNYEITCLAGAYSNFGFQNSRLDSPVVYGMPNNSGANDKSLAFKVLTSASMTGCVFVVSVKKHNRQQAARQPPALLLQYPE